MRKITVEEGHTLTHQLQDRLQEDLPEITHLTIHVEPSQ